MRLFKYCDAGGIEILRTASIKATSPLELNDPFDCQPVPDIVTPESRDALRSMVLAASQFLQLVLNDQLPPPPGKGSEQFKEENLAILEHTVSDENRVRESMEQSYNAMAIVCFSAVGSHHLMWAHYANKHQGLVIEVETDEEFALDGGQNLTNRLHEVKYSNERQIFRFDRPINLNAYTTKGEAWDYEHEWRVLYFKENLPSRVIAGREMHVRPIKPSFIRAVTMGAKMPDAHRREVEYLLSEPRYNHVELFQMQLDPREYHLTKVPVPRMASRE